MEPFDLAAKLVDSGRQKRLKLLAAAEHLPAVLIAESLQQLCYEVWTHDPQRVSAIVETLNDIADHTENDEIRAYAEWTEAIEALVNGDLEKCIDRIGTSENTFTTFMKPHLAAKTQTSKLYALALLGRYDEAVMCGQRALEVFLEHDDHYSAGKIEHNIGNLFWRRDMYREAEPYLESSHQRFTLIGDQRQLAMVENCQAFVKTLQNQFRDAETIYKRALDRANNNDLTVTEAEIETGLSNLYLFEGRYDLALKYMELSRRKYEELAMPNQSAVCELEIADIYLELNLLPEAIGFYKKVEERFSELGMQAELARCSLNHAQALIRLGGTGDAAGLLGRAEDLYEKEGNFVAAGSVRLARSQMMLEAGEFAAAMNQIEPALTAFERGENVRLELFARWIRAEIWRQLGNGKDARNEFDATLAAATEHSVQVEYLCRVSLGLLTRDEAHFKAAVDLVENSRATLSSDELRTSFFAERQIPFNELVKIKFAERLFTDAFLWHERSRSRTLVDSMQQSRGTDSNEELGGIREELNWYYNRIKRSSLSGSDERKQIESFRNLARTRERDYSELQRRLSSGGPTDIGSSVDLDVDAFRSRLGDTTLVEFAAIDGQISAFVISRDGLSAMPNYLSEADISREIAQFLFQIKTGRFIDRLSERNQTSAIERLQSHSRRIYDLLLHPLGDISHGKRLAFAPSGMLHYLPFQALWDGEAYLVENTEISYTPSSAVLDKCLQLPPADRHRALLAGVADELTPKVEAEIEAISRLFVEPLNLLGPDVNIDNLRRNSDGRGVVHLACHGKFRPDNPGFSSLALFEEELTVNEVFTLPLKNCIITLSACESGVNEVVPGEELIGLTRAFFSAGASSLLLSLWRVDDETTLDLMKTLYSEFCGGAGLAASLRVAQQRLLDRKTHPYFWSPFIVSGRW